VEFRSKYSKESFNGKPIDSIAVIEFSSIDDYDVIILLNVNPIAKKCLRTIERLD
jgi:hypothetical protein